MKPEANATNATATQTPLTKPTATSTKWPTTPIPLSIHNIPTNTNPRSPQVLDVEAPRRSPINPQPKSNTFAPRAPATASAAIAPTRDDTPWAQDCSSLNKFICWPGHHGQFPQMGMKSTIPALIKMEERTNTENAPQKQAVIPPPSDPR